MTKAVSTLLLVGWAILVGGVRPASAEDARPPRALALLVGVDKFADKQIQARSHAEDDAKALYDLVTDKGYLGAESGQVRLLLGGEDTKRGGKKATRANIVDGLRWLAKEAKRDDLVLLAYFGEGAPINDQGDRFCYYAADSTVKDRAKDAVSASEVAQELEKLKSEKFVVFLDVNFRVADGKGADRALEPGAYREFLGKETKEDHAQPLGRVLFLANNSHLPAVDVDKHGAFAQVLLDGLSGGADKEGYEPDGGVTLGELTTYVNKELPALVLKHGKTREQREQSHGIIGAPVSPSLVLVRNPKVWPKVQAQLSKLAASKDIPEKLREEGKRLLSEMPRLEADRKLRKEYQALLEGNLALAKFQEKRLGILDARKLDREEALEYARKVIKAAREIREGYVKEVNQGELIAAAIRGLYRRAGEKEIPKEIEERLTKAKELGEGKLRELLADARLHLGKREDLEDGKDVTVSLQRMLNRLDPYTTYIDPESKQRFDQDTQGAFTGIGIQIRKNIERDMLMVISPIKDSPAYKAGLLEGDVITKITREVDSFGKPLAKPEVISTKGLAINDAVKRILGQEGTKVKVTVEREGEPKPLDFEITRGKVELESVLGHRRNSDDSWDYFVDRDNRIAYVRLTQFSKNTHRDFKRVMRDLTKSGKVNGVVLDLRFNPGGLLDSAVKICQMFIDDGLVVTIKPRAGKEVSYGGRHSETSYLNFPMVCLVNGGSASGSEIVSACLQDHQRAVIVGERSYGKGSVQNIQPFEGGELKMTTASFWRPNGKNLNKSSTSGRDEDEWGVSPDKGFEVKLSRKEQDDLAEAQHDAEVIHRQDKPREGAKDYKDRQLEKALEYLRGEIKTAAKESTKKAG